MTTRLIAIIDTYNDSPHVGMLCQRLGQYVDKIHVVDGKVEHKGTPTETTTPYAWSTDGSLDAAEDAAEVVITHTATKPWKDSAEKQNYAFLAVEEGDYLLLLRGDMQVANPEELDYLPYESFDVGWVTVRNPHYARDIRLPLVVRYQEGMQCKRGNLTIFDEVGNVVTLPRHTTKRYRHMNLPLIVYSAKMVGSDMIHNTDLKPDEKLQEHPEAAGAVAQLPLAVKIGEGNPDYSLFIPFSRPWAVKRWAENFSKVNLPWHSTEIFAVVDSDDPGLYRSVCNELADKLGMAHSIFVWFSKEKKLPENSGRDARRARICRNWEVFLSNAKGAVMFGAEDDTLPEPDAYVQLMEVMRKHNAAFVQGTEVGRWGAHLLPHWRIEESTAEDEEGNPVRGQVEKIETSLPGPANIIPIQGGGWYCFVADMEYVRRCTLSWTEDPPMGPDVRFVYEITRMGGSCLGVWSVKCVHFGTDFELHPDTAPLDKLIMVKRNNKWETRKLNVRKEQDSKPEVKPEKRPTPPRASQERNVLVKALQTVHTGDPVRGMVFRGAQFWTTITHAKKLGHKVVILERATQEDKPAQNQAEEHQYQTQEDGPDKTPESVPQEGTSDGPEYRTK